MARKFGITTLNVNLTAAGTPQALSATAIYATGLEVYAPTGNTGANMYINVSGGATNQRRPIPRGTSWSPPDMTLTGTSGMYDLSQIFFDGDTTDDDVVVVYTNITDQDG